MKKIITVDRIGKTILILVLAVSIPVFFIFIGGSLFSKVYLESKANKNEATPKATQQSNEAEVKPKPTSKPVATITHTSTPEVHNVVTNPPLPTLNGGNIFSLVNNFRASNGIQYLSVSGELCALAESRADYMMANGMEAFKTSDTGGHTGLINVSNQYSGGSVGENLAANCNTDTCVLDMWKNSAAHRELMLWTIKDGNPINKGCVATRVSEVGSIVVLLVGDK